MGAGGSIETAGFPGFELHQHDHDTTPRYFCHSCNRIFQVSHLHGPVFTCILCDSSFIEEYTPIVQTAHNRRHQLQQQSSTLTQEQARRITNATAMLRLLELQLREELEQLQQAFEQANQRQAQQEQQKSMKLTAAMKVKLRQTEMTIDNICSQPSCPICSEDFAIGIKECKLPCSHIFHSPCVLPWLEMKHTCPICRSELTDTIPEITEFLGFEMDEIDEKLREIGVEVPDINLRTKNDMANLLHRKINDQKEKEAEQYQSLIVSGNRLSNGTNISDSEFLRVLHMPFLSMSLAGMSGFGDGPNISATIRLRNDEHDSDDDDDNDDADEGDTSADPIPSSTGATTTDTITSDN